MAQLIVRNIESEVVRRLKRNAAEHGRSAEEEHREILRNALCPKGPAAPDFKALLVSIPPGKDIFRRQRDLGRPCRDVKYLLDTIILSELRKPEDRRNPGLSEWIETVRSEELHLSVLVIGEVRKGIEQIRAPDPKQAVALDVWLSRIESFYADRILPITTPIAERWGRAQVVRTFPVIDGLLAATADEHGLQFVSRNLQDLAQWPGVHPHLNPFST